MDLKFRKLTKPRPDIAECLQKWENDPALIPLIRPNQDQNALEQRATLTVEDLEERLVHTHTFLIYLGGQLVGEMDYQIDPKHVYYGHPEMDLAYIDHFQPVPNDVFVGYQEELPNDSGFRERRDLWRIYGYLAVVEGATHLTKLINAVEKYLQFLSRLDRPSGKLKEIIAHWRANEQNDRKNRNPDWDNGTCFDPCRPYISY